MRKRNFKTGQKNSRLRRSGSRLCRCKYSGDLNGFLLMFLLFIFAIAVFFRRAG